MQIIGKDEKGNKITIFCSPKELIEQLRQQGYVIMQNEIDKKIAIILPQQPRQFPISACCNASVRVGGIGDFEKDTIACTKYYVCEACNRPCDLAEWIKSKQEFCGCKIPRQTIPVIDEAKRMCLTCRLPLPLPKEKVMKGSRLLPCDHLYFKIENSKLVELNINNEEWVRQAEKGEFDFKSMDAKVWAKEFMSIYTKYSPYKLDEEIMLGWFANAIMAGYDRGIQKGKYGRKRELMSEDLIRTLELVNRMAQQRYKWERNSNEDNEGWLKIAEITAHALIKKIAKPEFQEEKCAYCPFIKVISVTPDSELARKVIEEQRQEIGKLNKIIDEHLNSER